MGFISFLGQGHIRSGNASIRFCVEETPPFPTAVLQGSPKIKLSLQPLASLYWNQSSLLAKQDQTWDQSLVPGALHDCRILQAPCFCVLGREVGRV